MDLSVDHGTKKGAQKKGQKRGKHTEGPQGTPPKKVVKRGHGREKGVRGRGGGLEAG